MSPEHVHIQISHTFIISFTWVPCPLHLNLNNLIPLTTILFQQMLCSNVIFFYLASHSLFRFCFMAQVRYCVMLTIPLGFRKLKCKRYLPLASTCLLRCSCSSWTDWGRPRGMLCRIGSNSSGIQTIQLQAMGTLTITTVIIFPSIPHTRLVVGVNTQDGPMFQMLQYGQWVFLRVGILFFTEWLIK